MRLSPAMARMLAECDRDGHSTVPFPHGGRESSSARSAWYRTSKALRDRGLVYWKPGVRNRVYRDCDPELKTPAQFDAEIAEALAKEGR